MTREMYPVYTCSPWGEGSCINIIDTEGIPLFFGRFYFWALKSSGQRLLFCRSYILKSIARFSIFRLEPAENDAELPA